MFAEPATVRRRAASAYSENRESVIPTPGVRVRARVVDNCDLICRDCDSRVGLQVNCDNGSVASTSMPLLQTASPVVIVISGDAVAERDDRLYKIYRYI
jgi:hypothetical protein